MKVVFHLLCFTSQRYSQHFQTNSPVINNLLLGQEQKRQYAYRVCRCDSGASTKIYPELENVKKTCRIPGRAKRRVAPQRGAFGRGKPIYKMRLVFFKCSNLRNYEF